MAAGLVVTNGRLVTPEDVLDADVAVEDGEIAAIGDERTFPDAERTVNTSGLLVMPGVVDPHVHIDGYLSTDSYETGPARPRWVGSPPVLISPGRRGSAISASGRGKGTLLEAVERQKGKGDDSLIDFGLHSVITREDPAVFEELDDVIAEGVTPIKMFTAHEIGLSNGFMNRVFGHLADRDLLAVLHTEDESVCEHLTEASKAEGKGHPRHYPAARLDYAEAMAAENAVRMAQEAGAKYYGIHTTSRKAADVLECYQGDGSEVRGETCTHYTVLGESAHEQQGSLPIIAPPLRTPDDRDAMFEQLHDGALSVVSTDHVAFERADKEVENW